MTNRFTQVFLAALLLGSSLPKLLRRLPLVGNIGVDAHHPLVHQ